MDNSRQWSFEADMNYDGVITISDTWLWLKWLFSYPGDFVLYLMINKTPNVATFLEVTTNSYGGALSTIISLFFWINLWLIYFVFTEE